MVGIVSVPGSSLVGDPFSAFQLGQSRALGIQQQRQQLQIQQAQAERQAAQDQAEAAKQQRLQEILGQRTQIPAQLGGQAAQPIGPLGQPSTQSPAGITPIAPAGVAQGGLTPQALADLAVEFPERFEQVNKNLGLNTQRKKDEAADFAFKVRNTPFEQREPLIQQRANTLDSQRRDSSDTRKLSGISEQEQNQALDIVQVAALSPKERLKVARGEELTAGQREFAGLTEGLTAEQKQEARLIELGLSPRAVGSAIQTISAEGIQEQIGDASATIKEREKFGEKTGASRAKAIDSGFERIVKIDQNILNLDKAIAAVEAGAGTGAIERRFPSIKAASVELDQIQGELALDVIGAVTFGALSEGELALAKQIALPTGLEGPQLIQHLRDRQSAQQKLRSYFNEQIDFLDQGGSVAGFLRNKERQVEAGGTAQPGAAQTQQQNIVVDF